MDSPVQTALCSHRTEGAPFIVMSVHLSVAGSYRPPVAVSVPHPVAPPQTSISLPDQTGVVPHLPAGAPVVVIAVQVSDVGSYRPPVLKATLSKVRPPHTIISV